MFTLRCIPAYTPDYRPAPILYTSILLVRPSNVNDKINSAALSNIMLLFIILTDVTNQLNICQYNTVKPSNWLHAAIKQAIGMWCGPA